MAINTQGFQLSVMPRYTPADPSLVALNPMIAGEGVKQSLQIGQLLQYIQAQKAAEAEREATRQARIAAANAGANRSTATDLAFTPLAGQEAATRKAQLDQMNALFPAQTGSMLAGLNLSKATSEAELPLVGQRAGLAAAKMGADLEALTPEKNARIAGANFNAANSNANLSLLPQKLSLSQMEMGNKAAEFEDEALLRKPKRDLAQKQLTSTLDTFDVDKERKTKVEEAKLAATKAETTQALAHADYFLNGGASKSPRPASQKLGELALVANRLQSAKYMLPNGQTGDLAAYKASVYDKNGAPKQEGSVPMLPDIITPGSRMREVRKDPNAEMALKVLDGLQGVQNQLVQEMAGDFGGGAPSQPQISPEDQAAAAWVSDPANQKNPNYAGVLAKLKAKGIIK